MKPITLDTLLLFLYSFQNITSSTWSIFYPYLASYLKHFNPLITMKGIFACTLSMFIGRIIGGLILPHFYFLFGIKISMQIGILISFVNFLLFFCFTSYFWVVFNILLVGVHYQFVVLSVGYFLTEKYRDGFERVNFVNIGIGSSLGIIFWGFVSVFIINPGNKGMELVVREYAGFGCYFEWEVAKNFKTYMVVLALQSLLFFIPTFYLKDPENIKPNFIPYISALFSGNKRAIKDLKNSFSSQKNLLEKSFSLINSEKSVEENFLEDRLQLSYKEAKTKSIIIIKNPYFLLLILLLSLRFTGLVYFVDNYKIITYHIINNDKLVSFALSISVFSSIIGQLVVSFIWKKLDFYWSQIFLYFLLFLNLIILIVFSENRFVMFWIVSFIRICVRISYGLAALTKFSLFHPKIGVEITKVFDFYSILAILFGSVLNYFFDFSFIFEFILFLNLCGFLVLFFFFKNFKKMVKEIEFL